MAYQERKMYAWMDDYDVFLELIPRYWVQTTVILDQNEPLAKNNAAMHPPVHHGRGPFSCGIHLAEGGRHGL